VKMQPQQGLAPCSLVYRTRASLSMLLRRGGSALTRTECDAIGFSLNYRTSKWMPMAVLPRLPRFQRAVDHFYLNWQWRIAEGLHPIPRVRDRLISTERRRAWPFYDPWRNGRSGGGCNRMHTGLSRAARSWPTLRRLLMVGLAPTLAPCLS
jgi:hypothetical protein